jgi:hypothetical protein
MSETQTACKFRMLLQHSILSLPEEGLRDIFSFQISPWATENMLPTTNRLSGTGLSKIIYFRMCKVFQYQKAYKTQEKLKQEGHKAVH